MKYSILIAEDLEDSRIYLKTILEAKGHQVTETEDGRKAHLRFQEASFDLVITDINMPEMDGLKLLSTIKKNSPQTPVIVISAYRELETVIEALRGGACDYIMKPYEENEVYDSLERVSRLRKDIEVYKVCLSYLITESRQFVFGNNPDHISLMAQFICRDLAVLNFKAEMQPLQLSLIEAINNAVFHGNLEISSKLKNHEDKSSYGSFLQMAKQRFNKAPYSNREVTIDYRLENDKVCYVVRDQGRGFDHQNLPDPKNPESFFKPSGRGLLMIRSFCDEVRWNETGNEITLIKNLGGDIK